MARSKTVIVKKDRKFSVERAAVTKAVLEVISELNIRLGKKDKGAKKDNL